MRTTLTRPRRLDLEAFSQVTGLHPDLARRLVTLGVLAADQDTAGALWFHPSQITEAARIRRLRAAFALNYASLALVCDLLDRVAALESAMRHHPRQW
jgi:chaperone modulatory protein CbpM